MRIGRVFLVLSFSTDPVIKHVSIYTYKIYIEVAYDYIPVVSLVVIFNLDTFLHTNLLLFREYQPHPKATSATR